MGKLYKYIAALFILFVLLGSIAFGITSIAINRSFYVSEIEKYNIVANTGTDKENLMLAVDCLLEYIDGQRAELDVIITYDGKVQSAYNQDERAHMVDVMNIFALAKSIVIIAIISLLLLILLFLFKGNFSAQLWSGCKLGGTIIAGCIIVIGIAAAIDFNWTFDLMHELIFTNKLWLLDYKTDFMIRFLPWRLFRDAGIYIVVFSIITSILLYGLLYGLKRRNTHGLPRSGDPKTK